MLLIFIFNNSIPSNYIQVLIYSEAVLLLFCFHKQPVCVVVVFEISSEHMVGHVYDCFLYGSYLLLYPIV